MPGPVDLCGIFFKIVPCQREYLFAVNNALFGGFRQLGKGLVRAVLTQIKITDLPMRKSVGRCKIDRTLECPLGVRGFLGLLVCPAELDPPTIIVWGQPHDFFQHSCGTLDIFRVEIFLHFGGKEPSWQRITRSEIDGRLGNFHRIWLGRRRQLAEHISNLPSHSKPRKNQRSQYYADKRDPALFIARVNNLDRQRPICRFKSKRI